MKHSRKMYLVPEAVMHVIQQQHDIDRSPLLKTMSSLNQQMNNTLQDPNVPAEIKIKNHDQLLHRYLNLQEQRENHIPSVKLHTTTEAVVPQEAQPSPQEPQQPLQPQSLPESEILETIPRSFRSQANGLLRWIKKTPEAVQWDERGEVSLDGKSIRGSSISDLIGDIVRSRKGFSPTGRDEFTKVLAKLNTPEDLVRNENRRRMMASLKAGARRLPRTPSDTLGLPTPLPTPPSRPRKQPISPGLQRRGLKVPPRGKKTLDWISY